MSAANDARSAGGTAPSRGAGPLRGAARALLAFVETRVQIASNEFEEQFLRMAELAVLALALLCFAIVALVLGSAFVVVFFWESKEIAAGALALAYGCAALACAYVLRRRMAERPRLLSATLQELARDRDKASGAH